MKHLNLKFFLSGHLQLATTLFLFVAVTNSPFAHSGATGIPAYAEAIEQPLVVSRVLPAPTVQLETRISGNGLLICSGAKSGGLITCKGQNFHGADVIFHTDLFKVVSSGWRLTQVLPDEAGGVWVYFFQK